MMFTPLGGWFGWGFLILALLALCLVPLIRGIGPRWRWWARIGVVLVLAVALSRPGIAITATTEEYEASADVYFLVDTTTSMAAEDFDGTKTRLDGVKSDMLALAKDLPGTRLSIITFAATAFTSMPLTTDHSAFASAVDVLGPEISMNSNGSSITEAGAELDKRITANAEDRPDNTVLVFYFGDGEQTVSTPPESWAGFASKIDSGSVFGYGTTGGGKMRTHMPSGYGESPGPSAKPDFVRDAQGQPGISKIDEGNLKKLAGDLGVDYHHRTGATSMSSDYTAPKFEQNLVTKDGRVTVDEYFWIPLILVFAWITVELVLGVRELIRLRGIRGAVTPGPGANGHGPRGVDEGPRGVGRVPGGAGHEPNTPPQSPALSHRGGRP